MLHYWSHHEKQIIIDQCVIFMGGLDLCFGWFETINYPLKDIPYYYTGENKDYEDKVLNYLQLRLAEKNVDSLNLKFVNQKGKWFTGQDYYNTREYDFENVFQYKKSLIKRTRVPWMPWRDIGVYIIGDVV